MPQLRQDPITLNWVNIATERAKRPTAFTRAVQAAVTPNAKCPFCLGHESMTPPETMAFRAPGAAPDTEGWDFRVVPNLFAAFGPKDGLPECSLVGPYETMKGVGVHEVLVDSPDHFADLADHSVEKVNQIIAGYIDRYNAAAKVESVEYIQIIVNHGREAGASLEHPHSQLFGIPLVPFSIETELDGVERYRAENGTCPFCQMNSDELRIAERIIYENNLFVVFAPFASRQPFESWISPKSHNARFETIGAEDRLAFADALHALTAKLKRGLNDPPFNAYIHTAPTRAEGDIDFHWHLELMPKLSIAAGFELGTGMMINVATPESCAEFLRGVDHTAPI